METPFLVIRIGIFIVLVQAIAARFDYSIIVPRRLTSNMRSKSIWG